MTFDEASHIQADSKFTLGQLRQVHHFPKQLVENQSSVTEEKFTYFNLIIKYFSWATSDVDKLGDENKLAFKCQVLLWQSKL